MNLVDLQAVINQRAENDASRDVNNLFAQFKRDLMDLSGNIDKEIVIRGSDATRTIDLKVNLIYALECLLVHSRNQAILKRQRDETVKFVDRVATLVNEVAELQQLTQQQ